MPFCYILYSPKLDKFYVGYARGSVEERLVRHNISFYGSHYTSKANDWEVFFAIECESVTQAMRIEKHIKRMKSKKYYYDLKKYPEISGRLKNKYKGI